MNPPKICQRMKKEKKNVHQKIEHLLRTCEIWIEISVIQRKTSEMGENVKYGIWNRSIAFVCHSIICNWVLRSLKIYFVSVDSIHCFKWQIHRCVFYFFRYIEWICVRVFDWWKFCSFFCSSQVKWKWSQFRSCIKICKIFVKRRRENQCNAK